MIWIAGLARRRAPRLIGLVTGVALTVGLIALLGSFFAATEATMTQRAARAVPVDWQVQLTPGTSTAGARKHVASAPGVVTTEVVGFGDATGFASKTGRSVQTTGAGKVLGLPRSYSARFPGELRFLVGARSGVLLAQQTAANLRARVGSRVTIGLPGGRRVAERVNGIVDLPAADSLFQTVGAPPGSGITAPPDNVALLPFPEWKRVYTPIAHSQPASVYEQIHVQLSRALPADPGAAFAQLSSRALNLEATLAGHGKVGNNLGAQLDAARSDAIYAQLLFVFLGLPGALLAAALTIALAASGRERRRKEQALLRIRGARPRSIGNFALYEAMLTGGIGAALGVGVATLVARSAFSTASLGPTHVQSLAWSIAAVVAGLAVAGAGIVIPARRDARGITVTEARAAVATKQPLWQRTFVDVILLGAAGLIYWKAVKSGYQVVLAPEGVPTISVDYFTLLAPVCLWVGATLFVWRCARLLLTRGRAAIERATRPIARRLSNVVALSMGRQHKLLSRGLVMTALAIAFALSTSLFNATFAAQSRVDAQLTNGSDVTATTSAGGALPPSLLHRVRALPGVAAAETMQHRFAYVGNDLQDLYGIHPASFGTAAPVSNAFFANGDAPRTFAQLAARPDGVLVSDETVKDFQLRPGDLLRLRLQVAGHGYSVIPFHYVGIVREFPTAPSDSFIVANASYVGRQTHSSAAQTLLTKTSGSPPAVAGAVRNLVGPGSGVTVTDIDHQLHQTLSGLPAIDLSGLTRVELFFALLLAAGASGLVLILGLTERARTFAILAAIGARAKQLGSFVWSEASFVTFGGIVSGVVIGWVVAFMLVKILTGVFDPPPEHLSIPVGYLVVVGATTLGAVCAAAVWMVRATKKPAMTILRDL